MSNKSIKESNVVKSTRGNKKVFYFILALLLVFLGVLGVAIFLLASLFGLLYGDLFEDI